MCWFMRELCHPWKESLLLALAGSFPSCHWLQEEYHSPRSDDFKLGFLFLKESMKKWNVVNAKSVAVRAFKKHPLGLSDLHKAHD